MTSGNDTGILDFVDRESLRNLLGVAKYVWNAGLQNEVQEGCKNHDDNEHRLGTEYTAPHILATMYILPPPPCTATVHVSENDGNTGSLCLENACVCVHMKWRVPHNIKTHQNDLHQSTTLRWSDQQVLRTTLQSLFQCPPTHNGPTFL